EFADALLEGGVLGGDSLDCVLGPFGFEVADAAAEFADVGALGEDLAVGGLERVLGVERAFAPARLPLLVLRDCGPARMFALFRDCLGDSSFRALVGVEEGAGDGGATRD